MKLFTLILTIVIGVVLLSCSNDDNQSDSFKLTGKTIFNCNSYYDKLISLDTLYYYVDNDTLKLAGSMMKGCGSCLSDFYNIKGDTVNIYIEDVCGSYLDCICSYGLYYTFTNFQGKVLYFKVYFKYRESSEYNLWRSVRYPMYLED
jgi:hypothetical protein